MNSYGLNTMGLLFENLCIHDLKNFTDYLDETVYHYRNKKGLEYDLVIYLKN